MQKSEPALFPTPWRNAALSTSPTVGKLALIGAGLWLLDFVSGNWIAPLMLLATSAAAFVVAVALARSARGRLATILGRGTVPATLLAIVALNVGGAIGTLTGSRSTIGSPLAAAFVALPFYALAQAAFVTEIALGRMALPRFLDFLTYTCLPMKLLAGPLELPGLIDRIARWSPRIRRVHLLYAWPWIVLGAFMKFVIASRLQPSKTLPLIDPVGSFLTALVFELKFYFDFAGYSFLAYGFAVACGIRISQNFRHPFLARNIVLFWRSWHISLGRFLSRYLLDPNVRTLRGKTPKLLLASSIFLASAMWHGGTVNYLLWGLFHAICYFSYVSLKHRLSGATLPTVVAMLLFFVFGRMLAIDADTARVLARLSQFGALFTGHWPGWPAAELLNRAEALALLMAALFLALELACLRWRDSPHGYHFFRRPLMTAMLFVVFLLLGIDASELLYARI